MLLWLLNVVTSEAKDMISSYFDPSHPTVSRRDSGSGGVLGGLSINTEGSMATDLQPLNSQAPTGQKGKGESETKKERQQFAYDNVVVDGEQLEERLREREDSRFDDARATMEDAIAENEALGELEENLVMEITPEGLRIQIIDQEGDPMFPSGSAEMLAKTRELMKQVASIIIDMPNNISIRGHTDANPFPEGADYTNWELSADRANSTRRVLAENPDIDQERFIEVIGKEANDPFIEEDPFDARNRRISIILLRETLEEAVERGEFGDNIKKLGEDETADKDASIETLENAPAAVPAYDGPVPTEEWTEGAGTPIHPDDVPKFKRRQRDKGFEPSEGEFFFP